METNNTLEPAAKILAATALSQSFSFCMERKYLEQITSKELNPVFDLEAIPNTLSKEALWIEIKQIGKPLDDSAENCFTAIQKILHSCFLPKEAQLLFLLIGNEKENHLYLGLRALGNSIQVKSVIKNLNEFVKGIWPGLQTNLVSSADANEGLSTFIKNMQSEDSYEEMYALTGIPSMESQYKSVYPATIDKLMAGMNKSKGYAYLVVADPIESNDVESMLYQCREMNGQAESLKSMNVTEGKNQGWSQSQSQSYGESYTKGTSTSVSTTKKDFSGIGKAVTGLGIAASVFPAAGAVLNGAANLAGTAMSAVAGLYGLNTIIDAFVPQKTTSESTSESYGTSTTSTESQSINAGQSQSLSRNIVNKHIEAVSEHLFYHSKRFETGKAIGMWKAGVYLMAERKTDLQGASMQLRSILSGQESIFEPIRVHDISNIMGETSKQTNKSLKKSCFSQFDAPTIMINGADGRRFNHPLGGHYKELKSVLTTKELSYLINFPLRSVPGISVIDSSPEFSLNQVEISADKTVSFGNLLYGGSETKMEYQIPFHSLAKHTLLSGINGSGKTNTAQAILNSIAGEIPFLVIEPAKTEYVDWALAYNEKHPDSPINIYIPGCTRYKTGFTPKSLKLNPFEIVWLNETHYPNVLSHIDRLKSTFAAAFPMYDILPVLMEDLIYTIYQNKSTDWLTQEPVYKQTMPPTLNSMSVSVDKVISNRQYEERIERNMKACLNTRIDSLKRGWKGEMLNTIHSTSWEELFEKPCLINLSYVGDDVDKSFFMALILQFLYEYRSARVELGQIDFNDNSCKHLTVIEEAHRVMAKCENQELPQYKSAMMFSNMLSEIRAYGEGMFLVDQVPTRLIPDAIKNTNLKITHRLVAEDDSKAIGESMGLSDEQRKIIPKLMTGQCIVSDSLSTDTYWIKVNKVK